MKKLGLFLSVPLASSFRVGCRDTEALEELETFKARASEGG